MLKKIFIATSNKNKLLEIKNIIKDLDLEILSILDYDNLPNVEETGESFEENSFIKAKAYFEYTKIPSLADDSGLEVYSLNNKPGIYSSRYSGFYNDYYKNNIKLLKEMKDIEDRRARFRCCLTIYGENINYTSSGTCEGIILKYFKGQNGFGYDPIFFYKPLNKTFAEMSDEEKNSVSHRAKAFEDMKNFIKTLL